MKKRVKNVVFLMAIVALIMGCKKETTETINQKSNSEISNTNSQTSKKAIKNSKTASFEIQGMTCAVGCAGLIENKLNKLEGVSQAKVNFETKTATVTFDSKMLNQEKLTKTVENIAGGKLYKVNGFKL